MKSKGFTLIELLVVISIVSLLISILLPALGKARAAAQQAKCMSLVRGYTAASLAYMTQTNGAYMPYYYKWIDPSDSNEKDLPWYREPMFVSLLDGIHDGTYYSASAMCPSASLAIATNGRTQIQKSFGYNRTGLKYTWTATPNPQLFDHDVLRPTEKLMFSDALHWAMEGKNSDAYIDEDTLNNPISGDKVHIAYRHNDGASVSFYDGHCKWNKRELLDVSKITSDEHDKVWDLTVYDN